MNDGSSCIDDNDKNDSDDGSKFFFFFIYIISLSPHLNDDVGGK